VLVNIANNRPYAQLITLSGASLDVAESSFATSLEGALARMLTSARSPNDPAALLIGPREHAIVQIDRPAPGQAQEIHIDPAPVNAFAVGALGWALVSTAANRLSLPAVTQACITAAVDGALMRPRNPELAFRRMHRWVNFSKLSANVERLLRGLTGRVLRNRLFQAVIRRESAEPRPARIAFTVASSNPNLINPAIHLGPASFGTLPGGRMTVEHLTATGGSPPYRFYIVPESGGPEVPPWLHLAADGILAVEPPVGSAVSVNLPVEVGDSNGEHSLVPY